MRKKLVYVAGPISKGDIVDNCRRAHDAGMALVRAGLSVIVPHGNCFWGNAVIGPMGNHAFIPEAQPGGLGHAAWVGMDLEIVRRCDAVLRLSGDSVGADLEVAEAAARLIPVFGTVEGVVRWAQEEGTRNA
jgi:hypothetical protein